ncbi:hypothetical protein RintRC_2607 [Richelia intracellularis]|nr:hypothetical protein RintRC_2607 [Richelia intracellularis]
MRTHGINSNNTSSNPCIIGMALLNQGMISLNFQRFINGFKP